MFISLCSLQNNLLEYPKDALFSQPGNLHLSCFMFLCEEKKEVAVYAVVLFKRFVAKEYLHPDMMYLLIVVSVGVASKFEGARGNFEDKYIRLAVKIDKATWRTMERTFLNVIEWAVYIKTNEYTECGTWLTKASAHASQFTSADRKSEVLATYWEIFCSELLKRGKIARLAANCLSLPTSE